MARKSRLYVSIYNLLLSSPKRTFYKCLAQRIKVATQNLFPPENPDPPKANSAKSRSWESNGNSQIEFRCFWKRDKVVNQISEHFFSRQLYWLRRHSLCLQFHAFPRIYTNFRLFFAAVSFAALIKLCRDVSRDFHGASFTAGRKISFHDFFISYGLVPFPWITRETSRKDS